MKIVIKKDYADERRKNYMPIGDQLDALYEMAKYLKDNGEALPEKVTDWIENIEITKNRIKKI